MLTLCWRFWSFRNPILERWNIFEKYISISSNLWFGNSGWCRRNRIGSTWGRSSNWRNTKNWFQVHPTAKRQIRLSYHCKNSKWKIMFHSNWRQCSGIGYQIHELGIHGLKSWSTRIEIPSTCRKVEIAERDKDGQAKNIIPIYQISMSTLAPSSHWEFSMSILKLNVVRAPEMASIFGYGVFSIFKK